MTQVQESGRARSPHWSHEPAVPNDLSADSASAARSGRPVCTAAEADIKDFLCSDPGVWLFLESIQFLRHRPLLVMINIFCSSKNYILSYLVPEKDFVFRVFTKHEP